MDDRQGGPVPDRDARVTVVMITRDRREDADASLTRLTRLPERPAVIVVDNGSTDGTARMVRDRHPGVTLIEPGVNLGSAGRTLGVRAADTPYVAFSDDDSWWEPGALGRAADVLDAHPTLAVIAAHVLVGDGRADPVCDVMARSPLPPVADIPGTPVLGFLAGMSVVRRRAYLSVGGFLPRVGVGGEEAWLAADLAAAGWRLSYLPSVVARHRPSTRRDSGARARRDLRNALWFAWTRRHPRAVLRRSVVLLRAAGATRDTSAAVCEALRAPAWVLRHRRPVPRALEADLTLLDDAR
jgi:N-acetylglucosaminyl-diphospho-decaprenol L-rhamnosyltransferase